MAYEDEHFVDKGKPVWNYSLFLPKTINKFQAGLLSDGYRFFGAHPINLMGTDGVYFAVWAPNARRVCVAGSFNDWQPDQFLLFPRLDKSGIWEGFVPGVSKGDLYKYSITPQVGQAIWKADPYAFFAEKRPMTASRVWDLDWTWNDDGWMGSRKFNNALNAPWNVYELHLGSWMRPDRNNHESYHGYAQIAELLIPYVLDMGFTHVEFMPIMEHPLDASWGYQCTGYFAATSRFGDPQGLMALIDKLHQSGVGVILDWVPSHFPGDEHGLYKFDGEHTYEYADARKGFHPDWNSYIFNYARGEVRSFLISSAHFWLNHYHADGLRVDAVNSIIRLDFSRPPGTWEPNEFGGRENIEAIHFLKDLNRLLYQDFPDIQTIAEEASDWPGITIPLEAGGFGFGMKWMMGWMHDTFRYFKTQHQLRGELKDTLSFSMMYFYDEKFMLPLSHDEVVHGKSPMLYKMPGLEHEKFANLRLLYAYMFTHPGAKLLFMGNEFGQTSEWDESGELDWHLLDHVSHQKLKHCVRKLSQLYRNEPALHQRQFDPEGFEWIDLDHRHLGILIYRRRGEDPKDDLLVILNASNQNHFICSLPCAGKTQWQCIFNSNHVDYWGTEAGAGDLLVAEKNERKSSVYKINVNLSPLSLQIYK
jgi:1,4-alpha-glucan branching enzyme